MTIIESRWKKIQALPLESGGHQEDAHFCVMEAAAYVAGEPWLRICGLNTQAEELAQLPECLTLADIQKAARAARAALAARADLAARLEESQSALVERMIECGKERNQ